MELRIPDSPSLFHTYSFWKTLTTYCALHFHLKLITGGISIISYILLTIIISFGLFTKDPWHLSRRGHFSYHRHWSEFSFTCVTKSFPFGRRQSLILQGQRICVARNRRQILKKQRVIKGEACHCFTLWNKLMNGEWSLR